MFARSGKSKKDLFADSSLSPRMSRSCRPKGAKRYLEMLKRPRDLSLIKTLLPSRSHWFDFIWATLTETIIRNSLTIDLLAYNVAIRSKVIITETLRRSRTSEGWGVADNRICSSIGRLHDFLARSRSVTKWNITSWNALLVLFYHYYSRFRLPLKTTLAVTSYLHNGNLLSLFPLEQCFL